MNQPIHIKSITVLHELLQIEKPKHPLISVFDFSSIVSNVSNYSNLQFTSDFYVVAIKQECTGKFKYGQNYYDYDDGVMYFTAPNQVVQFEDMLLEVIRSKVLVIHQDFLYGYTLAATIKNYGYFSYATNEALFLSVQEEQVILDIFENISKEINANIDSFTQDLLISNIELLLKYNDRFYNRQFLTRKKVNSDLFIKLESLLDNSFKNENLEQYGIPSVQYIANELNLSPNYLSDMLRVQTGQTTQQHIQNRLIDKAKELLSTTNLSVSEIAYQLGFEHSQSFHRLFKNRTNIAPLEFRQSFN
ncbi:MAG: helix-turn-helix transcriptional regulator [Chitinophagales bacterium]|nr:helix-turn-helix transcriptional regulator [Chitinophagales bacterium]